MLSLNAMNDPAVGRREDFVRPQGQSASDYRYQRVVVQRHPTSQSPAVIDADVSVELRGALSKVGTSPLLQK